MGSSMSLVPDDTGELHEVLTSRANTKDTHPSLLVAQLFLDGILGLPGVLPQEMLRILEFCLAIMNIEVNPAVRGPLNHHPR